MIISTTTSGLGNQLFQYALARQLSMKRNSQIYLDIRFYQSEYSRQTKRSFKLSKFNINYKELNRPLELLIKVTKLFPQQSFLPFFTTIKEKKFHFEPKVLQIAPFGFANIKGYWQSEKYFPDVVPQLRAELQFNHVKGIEFDKYLKQLEAEDNAVSIHVRRGDYVDHPEFSQTFGFIGLDYYVEAIALIKAKTENGKFFIFTDDQEWVKENFPSDENFVFVSNTGPDADMDDMQLMSLCRNHIIANSSFSWWGAWLNPNPEKIVVAPKKWFKNLPDWDTKDLLPSTWVRL